MAVPSWVEFWRPEENLSLSDADDSRDFLETPKFPTLAIAKRVRNSPNRLFVYL
jgi:hypothetical protein